MEHGMDASAARPDAPSPSATHPPSAPKPSESWADMVDSMDVMPLEDARRLKPSDFAVKFGPIMDEKEFEAYRQLRLQKRRK